MPRDSRRVTPAIVPTAQWGERVIFAIYPETPGVELMSGSRVSCGFDAHMHECFTIGVTLEGTERFWCRRAPHVAAVGDIALLNPCEVHKGGPGPEGFWTYRMIYAQAAVLKEAAEEFAAAPGQGPRFPRTVVADPPLAAAVGALQQAMDRATSPLERQSLLLKVLSALIGRHSSSAGSPRNLGRESTTVARVREYLHANYAQSVRLHDLTELSGLSPSYLLRTFQRTMGMPPHAYLRQLRVERAKKLLAGGAALADAALAAGFSDQSHLTRCFKRILGLTPGVYAEAIRAYRPASIMRGLTTGTREWIEADFVQA